MKILRTAGTGRRWSSCVCRWAGATVLWAPAALLAAQNADNSAGLGAGEQEVIVQREAVRLIDPRTYRVSMQLEASRTIDLTAPVDGVVRTVGGKAQQKVAPQAEVLRLDDARAKLVLRRAKARLQEAQVEKKLAQNKSDADLVLLAESRLDAAQADLELAELDADRLVVRSPFGGEIERVYVAEGQFVRAGDRLATVVDPSKLSVEVPVERSAASPGKPIDIKVEETAVKASVESLAPLSPRFDALRELTVSPASAIVSIDNAGGKFASGQTVYSDLIPSTPVALVSTATISNQPEGSRRLQVLRDNVVRDLSVRILAKVGTESVYVSGRFSEGDEVIVSATKSLADGTPLRSLAAGGKGGAPAAGGAGSAGGKTPATGF